MIEQESLPRYLERENLTLKRYRLSSLSYAEWMKEKFQLLHANAGLGLIVRLWCPQKKTNG